MKVLVTGAQQPLGQAIIQALRGRHDLRVSDVGSISTDLEFVRADPRNVEDAERLMLGIEAVVHTASMPASEASPDPVDQEQQILDWGTRATYNLLVAAKGNKVRRFVHASTVQVVRDKADEWWVDERFRPRPHAEIQEMTLYLAERMAYHFAVETPLEVICLRLGKVVREEDVAGQPYDPDWVDVRDAAQAFVQAVEIQVYYRYQIFHIAANTQAGRWHVGNAMENLKYQPLHHFGLPPRLG
ncbi:MAG: NAD(P)-dependent oxidoreductase [Planctomycetes bacterium]|nr:NAD(P)-dependent oxidoreductase [Planctomycetota bacterium]